MPDTCSLRDKQFLKFLLVLVPTNKWHTLTFELQDLSLCLFGLYEHMETTSGKEDNLQEYTNIEDFREKHSIDLCACLTNFTYLYPNQAETYIKNVTHAAIAVCNDRSSNGSRRMICMRKVAITLGPGEQGRMVWTIYTKVACMHPSIVWNWS